MDKPHTRTDISSLWEDLKSRGIVLLLLVGLMWITAFADWILFHGQLRLHGIQPRTMTGLWGIFFAPFLHGGFSHLASNTIPFLLLGGLIVLDSIRDFFLVTVVVMLLGGLGVWIVGPSNSVHIGASGLIFGYLGFLLFRGFFDRRVYWIVISIVVGVLYGGLIFGVLPLVPGVSWQSHLFGFLAGIVSARLYKN